MNHLEASKILSDTNMEFVSPESARALDVHIAECEACKEWLATYKLFAGSLRESSTDEHLSSEDLCAFTLESSELSQGARERCERHLETCSECSWEAGLVRAAVREPSDDIRSAPTGPWVSRLNASPRRLAVAASVILAGGAFLMVGDQRAPAPKSFEMIGLSIQGHQSIEASETILVEATAIESGSVLSLESETVAFGNGFSVESGASLVARAEDGSQ